MYLVLSFSFFLVFVFGGVLFDFYLFSYLGIDFSFSLVFDFLSVGFFLCVSFISSVVFFYSLFYMAGTVDSRRFGVLVFLFVVSMFILVFSGNFVTTMVGWDGLGLVSFLLVIFYSNSVSLESGLITVFRNRVGDVFFLLSFFFLFLMGGFSWDFFFLFSNIFFLIFLFFGAITKSAQVPFSAWLPAAIAAPTPVSSLVHSSTLVTAGVYVIIRFNYMFMYFSFNFLKFFFVFTIVLAGFCAFLESDFKKIVAISTLSQLGMIIFIISVGVWILSFLHMVIHAFFKRILFLRTGSLIRQYAGGQDCRFYGGSVLSNRSFLFFLVRCVCLGGVPFFLGFYSKDHIISSCSFFRGFVLFVFFLCGCVFTVIYSFRLVYIAYFLGYKSFRAGFSFESPFFFVVVLILSFKCWILRGVFYWVFLSDYVFFLFFFDLFIGVYLVFIGLFLFFFVKFFFGVSFSFFSILFLRWKVSRGTSFYFEKMKHIYFENSWMETLGGGGVYLQLLKANLYLSIFTNVGLGGLVLLTFSFFYIYI